MSDDVIINNVMKSFHDYKTLITMSGQHLFSTLVLFFSGSGYISGIFRVKEDGSLRKKLEEKLKDPTKRDAYSSLDGIPDVGGIRLVFDNKENLTRSIINFKNFVESGNLTFFEPHFVASRKKEDGTEELDFDDKSQSSNGTYGGYHIQFKFVKNNEVLFQIEAQFRTTLDDLVGSATHAVYKRKDDGNEKKTERGYENYGKL